MNPPERRETGVQAYQHNQGGKAWLVMEGSHSAGEWLCADAKDVREVEP